MKRSRFMDELPQELDQLGAYRLRKIKKIQGEFPTFIYLHPKVGDRLKQYQTKLQKFLDKKGVSADIVCEPHISLSKVVALSYIQIDPFLRTFKNDHLQLMRKAPLYIKQAYINCISTGAKLQCQEKQIQPPPPIDQPPKQSAYDKKLTQQPHQPQPSQPKLLNKQQLHIGLSVGAHFIPLIKSVDNLMKKFNQPKYGNSIALISLIRVEGDIQQIKKLIEQFGKENKTVDKVNASIDKIHIRIQKKSYQNDLK